MTFSALEPGCYIIRHILLWCGTFVSAPCLTKSERLWQIWTYVSCAINQDSKGLEVIRRKWEKEKADHWVQSVLLKSTCGNVCIKLEFSGEQRWKATMLSLRLSRWYSWLPLHILEKKVCLGGNHCSASFDQVVKVIWNRAAHCKQRLHLKLRIFLVSTNLQTIQAIEVIGDKCSLLYLTS